jgi:ATP-dependent RNA helicase RhlE
MRSQVEKLRRGVDIIIACPGRLIDHLRQRTVCLDEIETVVLDEADQMFDMGFFPNIREILSKLPKKRQNLLFSATMPSDIRKLAEEILVDPARVEIGRVAPAVTVSHAVYPVEPHLKTALLQTLMQQTPADSVLIFTRTKHRAKKLALTVEKFGYKTASLQGNLSQNRRQDALDGFRSGKYQVLVATDIAARGIDVSSVSHVINYDIPETVEAYTHRIGRTGRAAKTGDAFTFISREDEWRVRGIEKVLGKRIERRTVEGFDYSARPAEASTEFARDPRPPRGGSRPQRSGNGSRRREGFSRAGALNEGSNRQDSRSAGFGGGNSRRVDAQGQDARRSDDRGRAFGGGNESRRSDAPRDGNRIDSRRSEAGHGSRGSSYGDSRGFGSSRGGAGSRSSRPAGDRRRDGGGFSNRGRSSNGSQSESSSAQ